MHTPKDGPAEADDSEYLGEEDAACRIIIPKFESVISILSCEVPKPEDILGEAELKELSDMEAEAR